MSELEVVMQHDFLLFSRYALVILLYVIACRMPRLISSGHSAILVSILLLYKYLLEHEPLSSCSKCEMWQVRAVTRSSNEAYMKPWRHLTFV